MFSILNFRRHNFNKEEKGLEFSLFCRLLQLQSDTSFGLGAVWWTISSGARWKDHLKQIDFFLFFFPTCLTLTPLTSGPIVRRGRSSATVRSPEMTNKAHLSIKFSKLGLRNLFNPCLVASGRLMGFSWIVMKAECLLETAGGGGSVVTRAILGCGVSKLVYLLCPWVCVCVR